MRTSEFAALAILSLCVACAPPPATRDASDLSGLVEPDRAFWRAWSVEGAEPRPPALDGVIVFDHWRFSPEGVSELWSRLFPVLDALRLGVADASSIELALAVLEPDAPGGAIGADASFVVSSTGAEWEGVVVRIWRELPEGAIPGVTVLLGREARGALERASFGAVWVSSEFSEAPPVTAALGREVSIAQGLEPVGPGLSDGGAPGADGGVLGVLNSSIWSALSQERYFEPAFAVLEESPEPPPRFAAPEITSRDLDQVYSSTAFLPRIRTGKFKF